MVGEIRDLETAEIAVQASLTGHLVLSTLHTNSAVGAITRLNDMGVEPFLLSSSLLGLMAQRLVRLLCPKCKRARPVDATEAKLLGVSSTQHIFDAIGCEYCQQLGYHSRTGIFEVLRISENMRRQIHNRISEQELEQLA